MALFAPAIAPYRPTDISYDVLMPPSKSHLFGTDHLGRDVFSRVVYGARVSLTVGFVAAGLSALIGIVGGEPSSGYIGGIFDEVLSKIIDSFLMFPVFFLILIIVAVFGRNLIYIMLVIGVTTWPIECENNESPDHELKGKGLH